VTSPESPFLEQGVHLPRLLLHAPAEQGRNGYHCYIVYRQESHKEDVQQKCGVGTLAQDNNTSERVRSAGLASH